MSADRFTTEFNKIIDDVDDQKRALETKLREARQAVSRTTGDAREAWMGRQEALLLALASWPKVARRT